MEIHSPSIRVLPNAVTVLAVCAGLSAVMFALQAEWTLSILAVTVAGVLDGLDGRIARLLDATSKMGAELDSLCDAVSFGVAPALTIFVWGLQHNRLGWIACLVFVVCMVLRLARFNTLLDDADSPPFAKEFFVGVPAPAGGLLLLAPLMVRVQFGSGWWSSQAVVLVWTVAISALLISRIPTLSAKMVRVSARWVAPLLVLVGLIAALVVTFPLGALALAMVLYLVHIPFSIRRYRWLAKHPEAWAVAPRERKAIRRSRRRLGIRPPLRRRVAGAARRAVGRQGTEFPQRGEPTGRNREHGRNWRRISLRRR